MKKVLLHACCAGCATVCIKRLQSEGYKVTGIFYNPNIHPGEEYQKRKKDFDGLAKKFGIEVMEPEYNYKDWFGFIQGHEAEKEGQKRCRLCFTMRLNKVNEIMQKQGFDFFTTTLTISPHKNAAVINEIGERIGKEKFLARDFKKQDGFKQSVACSKELGLYRQDYCGCVFSKKPQT